MPDPNHARCPCTPQDLLACLVLSECVYKKVEMGDAELADKISAFASQFPAAWLQLEAVQVSLPDLPQHYIVATGGDALYVAYMGTKQPRDLVGTWWCSVRAFANTHMYSQAARACSAHNVSKDFTSRHTASATVVSRCRWRVDFARR